MRPAIAWKTKPPMPATRPPVKRMAFCRTNRLVLSWTKRSRRHKVAPVCTVPRILLEASKCPGVDNSQRMPDSPKPIVSGLIVSHNTKDLLLQCMRALYASADVPVEAVVVDNDSSDGSAAAVSTEYPQATVLIQEQNLGFGRAANVGLERCTGRFILLINPDVTVDLQCVGRLADFMLTRPDAGAVGPRLLMADGSVDPAARRAFPVPSALFYRTIGLCYRLKLGGWKVFYLPTATAIHHERAAPDESEKRQMLYEEHRAMWTYHFKHHAEEQSAFGNGLVWAQIWGRWLAQSVRQSMRKERRTPT